MTETSVTEQQLAAERDAAQSDEAKRAAEKRAAAVGIVDAVEPPVAVAPKARKQTTRA